jgi:hypothetical protein
LLASWQHSRGRDLSTAQPCWSPVSIPTADSTPTLIADMTLPRGNRDHADLAHALARPDCFTIRPRRSAPPGCERAAAHAAQGVSAV